MAASSSLMAEAKTASSALAVGRLVPDAVMPGTEIPEKVMPGTVFVTVGTDREGAEIDAVLIAPSTSLRAEMIAPRLAVAVGKEMLGRVTEWAAAVLRAASNALKAEEIAAALAVGIEAVGMACSIWLIAVESNPTSPLRAVARTPAWLLRAVLIMPWLVTLAVTGFPAIAKGLI